MKVKLFFIVLSSVIFSAYTHSSMAQTQTVRTKNFIIHNHTLYPALTNHMAEVMEDRLSRYYPPEILFEPVHVYIENNERAMQAATGRSAMGFTTGSGSIYVRRDAPDLVGIASHELSHAVCVQLCPVEWPPWLAEGLAMLSEGIVKRNIADWTTWLKEGVGTLAEDPGDNWLKYIKKNGRRYDPQLLLAMRTPPAPGPEQTAFYADSTALVYFLLGRRMARIKNDVSPHEVMSAFLKEARISRQGMDSALARYFGIQGGVFELNRSFRAWEEKNIFSVDQKGDVGLSDDKFRKKAPPSPLLLQPPVFDRRHKSANAAEADDLIRELKRRSVDRKR